jgi:hypothetical protein
MHTLAAVRLARRCLGVALVLVASGCAETAITTPDASRCCDASDDAPAERDAGIDGCIECMEVDPFALLADRNLPARLLPGTTELSSSREIEPPSGTGNHDFDNESVLLDERGAGWIGRIWLTMQERATYSRAVSDIARLHVTVDGTEVLDEAVGTLTSGDHPAFPAEWVASRALASGAQVIYVPIAYSESIRVTLEHPPEHQVYYQIDWHRLDAGERPRRSFDGALDEMDRAALEAASARWIEWATPAGEMESVALELAAAGSEQLSATGPGVVRSVEITLSAGAPEDLRVTWRVDGEVRIDLPVTRWMATPSPAGDYESAFSDRETARRAFRLPMPFGTGWEMELTNDGAAPIAGQVVVEWDAEPVAELGALRFDCDVRSDLAAPAIAVTEIEGTRGQYAGQVVVVRGAGAGWQMMEGDHEVAVDGSYTLLGTGLEDYFGGSYYFQDGIFALPLSGAPGLDLHGFAHLAAPLVDVAMYRYHLLEAVPFESSIRFEYENYIVGSEFESCVYWYDHSTR